MGKAEKDTLNFLVVSDVHDDIEKIKIIVEKYKNTNFDYVLCCGDVVDVPIGKNDDKEVTDEYVVKLKNIFVELGKLAPVLWVPGNHEPGFYFNEDLKEEVTTNSFNMHKKVKKLDDKLFIVGLGGSTPILTGNQWKPNYILFKDLEHERDFKYPGYPYNVSPNNYEKSDQLFINDLNSTIDKAKKEGGDDVQIVYLTHIGPLYSSTNCIIENGEVLYLGSNKYGESFLKDNNGFVIIHGHSHTSEGLVAVNTGKYDYNPGACCLGRYGLIELKKSKEGKWRMSSFTNAFI